MASGQQELLIEIASFLNTHAVPYLLTGAWSVIYYGRPRASHDIDFVLDVRPNDTQRLLTALKKLPLEFSFQEKSVKEAIKKRGMFNILHLPTYLKLDFWMLTDSPFDRSRFARRQGLEILGQKMYLATAEDTILQKLRWYAITPSEKSLIDAAFVYQIQKPNLDTQYLDHWAQQLKVTTNLKTLGTIDLENYV